MTLNFVSDWKSQNLKSVVRVWYVDDKKLEKTTNRLHLLSGTRSLEVLTLQLAGGVDVQNDCESCFPQVGSESWFVVVTKLHRGMRLNSILSGP